jgi:hypothetical protein
MWKIVTIIGLGLLVFAVMLGFELYRRSLPPEEFKNYKGLNAVSSNDTVAVKMERLAEQAAMDAWSRAHIRVHIGIHSLPDFDRYLDLVSKSPGFKGSSDKDKRAEGMIGGAFVGEAIRRTHGGSWMESAPDLPDAGPFPLQVGNSTIWPVNWCAKRLMNGPEDNIYDKYVFLILKRTNDVHGEVVHWTNTSSGLKQVTNVILK